MAQEITLYKKCTQCQGTGEFQSSNQQGSSPIPCNWPGCNASGYLEWGKYTYDPGNDDVVNKCNDILDKCDDILEALAG